MAKVTRIKFNTPYYELGIVKYKAGEHYPVTPQTSSCVVAGHAETVEVDMKPQQAVDEQEAATAALTVAREATVEAEANAAKGGDAGTQGAEGVAN